MQTLAVQQGDLDKSGTCERMIWQRADLHPLTCSKDVRPMLNLLTRQKKYNEAIVARRCCFNK